MKPVLEIVFLLLIVLPLVTSNFDSKVSLFNPSGSIMQLEYAKKAILRSSPILAIRCVDGVLVNRFKRKASSTLTLKIPESNYLIDSHILLCVTGLMGDGQQVIQFARKLCDNYRMTFDAPIPIIQLCDQIADALHECTLRGSRPIGASFVVCGYDDSMKYQLYTAECDGTFNGWKAVAVGKYSTEMMTTMSQTITTAKAKATASTSASTTADPSVVVSSSTSSDINFNALTVSEAIPIMEKWTRELRDKLGQEWDKDTEVLTFTRPQEDV